MSPAKTAEPIEMPFGLGIGWGQGPCIRWECLLAPPEWRIRLNHLSAAAMQLYVKWLWPVVLFYNSSPVGMIVAPVDYRPTATNHQNTRRLKKFQTLLDVTW